MTTLYSLIEAAQVIYQMDDDPELMADILKGINLEIEDKMVNIAYVIKNLDGDVAALDTEIKRLQERKKSAENKQKRLKTYMHDSMVALDIKKIKTPIFSFNIQRNAPSVVITNENTIGEEYFKVKREVDKTALGKAIKAGVEVEGAELKYTESLRIR